MLIYAVTVLLSYLAMAASRETLRPMPSITNSLVNLGKMEISFYFNGHDSSNRQPDRSTRPSTPFLLQKPEPMVEESCPCSPLRSAKDTFLNSPSGVLNKILMNNDLFSSNKEPFTSALCCESHEHVQEGTVVLEFPSNPKTIKPFSLRSDNFPVPNTLPIPNNGMSLPIMPFLFDSLIPNKSALPPLKTKSIEIFLFPKKKDTAGFDMQKMLPKKKDSFFKDNVQIVGDKEVKNDINLFKLPPPIVKKDLNLQEKYEKQNMEKEKEIEKEKEKEKEEIDNAGGDGILMEPASKPNAV